MDATVLRTPRELLGRFTPTPWAAEISVLDRIIRLETNSEEILKRTLQGLELYSGTTGREVHFHWKIIVDSEAALSPPWPAMIAFAGLGLQCVNIGQRSFLAVDPDERVAVAFLAEGLAQDETGLRDRFLKVLVEMTATVLGIPHRGASCGEDGAQ